MIVLVKLQTLSLQLLPHYRYISSNLSTSQELLLQSEPQSKKQQFWNSMYIMLLRVIALHFLSFSLYVWLIGGQLFKNPKKNPLINIVCFQVQSMKKKGIHGNYKVKLQSGKCSAWYMKITRKLRYQFTDTKINWLIAPLVCIYTLLYF